MPHRVAAMDSIGLNAITYNRTWWVFSRTNGAVQFMWWIFSGLVSETKPRACRVRGLSAIMGLDGYMWMHFKQDHKSSTKERVLSHWAASVSCTDHSGLALSVTILPIYQIFRDINFMLSSTCYGAINLKNQINQSNNRHNTLHWESPTPGPWVRSWTIRFGICHTVDACLLLYLEIPQL